FSSGVHLFGTSGGAPFFSSSRCVTRPSVTASRRHFDSVLCETPVRAESAVALIPFGPSIFLTICVRNPSEYGCSIPTQPCAPLGDVSAEATTTLTQGGCVTDTCFDGFCQAGAPVVCQPLDVCHVAGVCDPQTGCSSPLAANGTACSDGNACTQG